jgi:hypothetical protein
MPLASRPEYPPQSVDRRFGSSLPKILLTSRTSLEVSYPSTISDAGSDLHWAYLTQLATPSGFLSLLTFCSALILPALFHAGTARGFLGLQRFSPRVSRQHLSMLTSLHVLRRDTAASSPESPEGTPTLTPWPQQPPTNAETLELGHQVTIRST